MFDLNATYPGPKGLGLIEAETTSKQHALYSECILGRKAWASLKLSKAIIALWTLPRYPGPKGLGLIEASISAKSPTAKTNVSWAERPGPH